MGEADDGLIVIPQSLPNLNIYKINDLFGLMEMEE